MDEEIRKKLQAVRFVEDVIAIGKECGRELTNEKAREIYDQLKSDAATGELSDSDLEAVAGGDLKDKLKTKIKAMLRSGP